MVILQVAASMRDWFVFNSDVRGFPASLRPGDGQQVAATVFLRQPREGLLGLKPGQLLLVVRCALHLRPRELVTAILETSLKKLGFVQSVLLRLSSATTSPTVKFSVLGTHVDDLVGTSMPEAADKVLERVKAAFDFGSWSESRPDEILEYGGKQVPKMVS